VIDEKKMIAELALSLSSNYFNCHARQRFYLINFYIIISMALLSTVYFVENEQAHPFIIIAHSAEVLITYVFYKLDKRTCFLIKNAEEVLRTLESQYIPQKCLRVYSVEKSKTRKEKLSRFVCFGRIRRASKYISPITYSECFGILFYTIGIYSSIRIFL